MINSRSGFFISCRVTECGARHRRHDGGVAIQNLHGSSEAFRSWAGRQVLKRVAGPQGPQRHEEIFAAGGVRWFAEGRPIRRVHADASMFVGGLRALLLQSLHPLAMAGVAGHSDYRHDPWGRLQRTSFFLAMTHLRSV